MDTTYNAEINKMFTETINKILIPVFAIKRLLNNTLNIRHLEV